MFRKDVAEEVEHREAFRSSTAHRCDRHEPEPPFSARLGRPPLDPRPPGRLPARAAARPACPWAARWSWEARPPPSPPEGAFAVVFAAPAGRDAGPERGDPRLQPADAPPGAGGRRERPAGANRRTRHRRRRRAGAGGGWARARWSSRPSRRLPDATEFVVTRAGWDEGARPARRWPRPSSRAFSTPRPHVERLEPEDGNHQLVPAQTFEARFDQPVDPREVERAVDADGGRGQAGAPRGLPRVAARPGQREARPDSVPAAPLPLASKVSLAFDASLRGTEGPLPMEETRTFQMATYGPLAGPAGPLLGRAPAARCHPGVVVRGGALEPRLLRRSSGRTCASRRPADDRVVEDARRRHARGIVLRAGGPACRDRVPRDFRRRDARRARAGARARRGRRSLDVGDLDPSVVVGMSGTVLEAASAAGRTVPVVAVNTPSYALAAGALDARQVADLLASREGAYERPDRVFARVSAWPGTHVERVSPGGGRNVSTSKRVAVEPLLAAQGGRGAFFIATEREVRVGNVTDLAITAKMSRFGSLVWVTRLSDGKPVAGRDGVDRRPDERPLRDRAPTPTDSRRSRRAATRRPTRRGRSTAAGIVIARLGDDWTWRQVGDVVPLGRRRRVRRRVGRAAAARDALHRPRRLPPGRDRGAGGRLPPAAAARHRDAGGAHAVAPRRGRAGRDDLRRQREARRLRRGRAEGAAAADGAPRLGDASRPRWTASAATG